MLHQPLDLHSDRLVLWRHTRHSPNAVGDLNLDGRFSIADFIILASHFNQLCTWRRGCDYDRSVTIATSSIWRPTSTTMR